MDSDEDKSDQSEDDRPSVGNEYQSEDSDSDDADFKNRRSSRLSNKKRKSRSESMNGSAKASVDNVEGMDDDLLEMQRMLEEKLEKERKFEELKKKEAEEDRKQAETHEATRRQLELLQAASGPPVSMSSWGSSALFSLFSRNTEKTEMNSPIDGLNVIELKEEPESALNSKRPWKRLRGFIKEKNSHIDIVIHENLIFKVAADIGNNAAIVSRVPGDLASWLIYSIMESDNDGTANIALANLHSILEGEEVVDFGPSFVKLHSQKKAPSQYASEWKPSAKLLREYLIWLGFDIESATWCELEVAMEDIDAKFRRLQKRSKRPQSLHRYVRLIELCAQYHWLDLSDSKETEELLTMLFLLTNDADFQGVLNLYPNQFLASILEVVPDDVWNKCLDKIISETWKTIESRFPKPSRMEVLDDTKASTQETELLAIYSSAFLGSVAHLPATSERCLECKVRFALSWARSERIQTLTLFKIPMTDENLATSMKYLEPSNTASDVEAVTHVARALIARIVGLAVRSGKHEMASSSRSTVPVQDVPFFHAMDVAIDCLTQMLISFEGVKDEDGLLNVRRGIYSDLWSLFDKLAQRSEETLPSMSIVHFKITDELMPRFKHYRAPGRTTGPKQTVLNFASTHSNTD